MLLTPHTLVGLAIGASVTNPFIAVPFSLGMHFMGDLVPHWDMFENNDEMRSFNGWKPLALMADLAIGVGFGMFFTLYALWYLKNPALSLNIFLCGVAAVLPDVLTAPSIYVKPKFPLSMLHKIQNRLQFIVGPPWGVVSQLVVGGFSLLLILRSLGL